MVNKSVSELDVDDIFYFAKDQMKRKLTRQEAEEIYESIGSIDCDVSFWDFIENEIWNYLNHKEQEKKS